jgi:hypothetical protein
MDCLWSRQLTLVLIDVAVPVAAKAMPSKVGVEGGAVAVVVVAAVVLVVAYAAVDGSHYAEMDYDDLALEIVTMTREHAHESLRFYYGRDDCWTRDVPPSNHCFECALLGSMNRICHATATATVVVADFDYFVDTDCDSCWKSMSNLMCY